jgi:transposase InsO family protein
MVVVDRYSKFAHFIAFHHPFLIASVSRLFIDNIYRLYCMPLSVVSDRDRVFTSKFWQLFFSMASTTLRMSSTYHPQTDGQTECVNQSLETYLRCFIHACPSRWNIWLPLAEFWYNSSPHSALGRSPFEVFYGKPPRLLGLDVSVAALGPELSKWLEERSLM